MRTGSGTFLGVLLATWLTAASASPVEQGQTVTDATLWTRWDHRAANIWIDKYNRFDDSFRNWLGYVPRVGGQEVSLDVRTRPFDHLELELTLTGSELGDDPAAGARLRHTAAELIQTWYFGPAIYLLVDYQLYRTRRTDPVRDSYDPSLISLQFSWTPFRRLHAYLGVRSGAANPLNPAGRGRSTELYLKIARTFRVRV